MDWTGRNVGPYAIVRVIARGSTATFYEATQGNLANRRVVLKAFPAEASESFRREVAAFAALNHPNIVPVYAVGEESGIQFYVMPYAEGEVLSGIRSALGRLDPARALPILRQIAAALDHAHAKGIVHLDLGLGQVRVGEEDHVTVFGFGAPAPAVGNPRHGAPEQIREEKVNGRADVCALAEIAFELLTGTHPNDHGDRSTLLERKAHPEAIDAVLRRAFATIPALRPSAREFAAALEALAAPDPAPDAFAASGLTHLIMIPDRPAHLDTGPPGGTFRVAPLGRPLWIVDRTEESGRVLLALRDRREAEYRVPEAGRPDFSLYLVERIFEHAYVRHIVLRLPPHLTDPDHVPHFVLLLYAQSMLVTLTEEEVRKIAASYLADRSQRGDWTAEEVTRLFDSLTLFDGPEEWATAPAEDRPRTLSDLTLGACVGEGAYARIYRAVSADGAILRAIKVAKRPGEIGKGISRTRAPQDPARPAPGTEALARAFVQHTGNFGSVDPDPDQLLLVQARKLLWTSDPAIPVVDTFGQEGDRCFCRMEWIEGETLRRRLNDGPLPLGIVLEVARAMDRLSVNPRFRIHGDLKPENIMVTDRGIKLLDPGHFGPLQMLKGGVCDCMVTTPSYYPYVAPDDVHALGIILWEMVCGLNPYASVSGPETRMIGRRLQESIRCTERVGNHFVSNLYLIQRPALERPGIPADLERVVVKALGLSLEEDGMLELGPRYETFADLARAIEPFAGVDAREWVG